MSDWLKNKITDMIWIILISVVFYGSVYFIFIREPNVNVHANQVWIENTGNPFEDTLNKYVVLEVKDGWVKYYKKYPPLTLQNKITGETFLVKSKPIRKFVRDKKVIKNE